MSKSSEQVLSPASLLPRTSCLSSLYRAAQRAFRERKQSQLAELQARLQSYEQGEVERNVAIQKIAKRLKDENELLHQENVTLKARVAELEAKAGSLAQETLTQTSALLVAEKKRGRDVTPPMDSKAKKRTRNNSMVDYPSTPLVSATDNFQSLPDARPNDLNSNSFNMSTPVPDAKTVDSVSSLPFACGLCEPSTLCVCHEIASQGTILDNLPAYEPPVPLRRRNRVTALNSIFPVQEYQNATCSGDPNNCLACAGDSFGQAFCEAIRSSSSNCDCSAETISRCCGDSSSCLGCPSASSPTSNPNQLELMPTNDAWQRLKAHPNVQFADLTLLANVVASRSQCGGPQLVISAPQPTADHSAPYVKDMETRRVGDSPPPRLVPQEVLLECGRRRMRQVHANGVRDALRLLDMK